MSQGSHNSTVPFNRKGVAGKQRSKQRNPTRTERRTNQDWKDYEEA